MGGRKVLFIKAKLESFKALITNNISSNPNYRLLKLKYL